MKKLLKILVILTCCCFCCKAQQVVSSGGYVVKSNLTVDWILGGSLTDFSGFETSNTFNEEQNALPDSVEFIVKVYPTLTMDFTTIEITNHGTTRFLLELYNNFGIRALDKIIMDKPVLLINLSYLPAGIYYLRISIPSEEQPLKSVKIVKN